MVIDSALHHDVDMIVRPALETDATGSWGALEFFHSKFALIADCLSGSLGYAEVFDFLTFARSHPNAAKVLRGWGVSGLHVGQEDVILFQHGILDTLRGVEAWQFHIRIDTTPDEAGELELQLSELFPLRMVDE
ncbi:MAG: hypothetical protein FWF43_09285 [Propionibacteriaceae bacterium]|nr:hypothetical protein [Propionibacteriaceae bacterium]